MLVWCFVELWSPIKTRELVRQVIFLESKGFHVGNVVSADFFRVQGFRNVSVTSCSAWPQNKFFANDLYVITLTDHNVLISCFIYWCKHIFLLGFFKHSFTKFKFWNSLPFGLYCLPQTANLRSKHSFTKFSSGIPCLSDYIVFLRLLTLDLTICFTCCTQS